MLSVCSWTRQGFLSASSPRIAATSSIRLLVVSGSPPESSRSLSPVRRSTPQPPGPGLPRHAPSVNISTSGGVVRDKLSRQFERHALGRMVRFFLVDVEAPPEGINHLTNQHFGRGGASSDSDGSGFAEP